MSGMVRSTARVANRNHRCSCGRRIAPGDLYVECVCSPGYLDNLRWWRSAECSDCAERYGRGCLLTARDASLSDLASDTRHADGYAP